jgi:hypothetical protein
MYGSPSADVPLENVSSATGRPEARQAQECAWPTDTQVWNWAESVLLSGYGPAAPNFL